MPKRSTPCSSALSLAARVGRSGGEMPRADCSSCSIGSGSVTLVRMPEKSSSSQ